MMNIMLIAHAEPRSGNSGGSGRRMTRDEQTIYQGLVRSGDTRGAVDYLAGLPARSRGNR